jgi:hypothetical protein
MPADFRERYSAVKYRPLSRSRRLLILLLATATAVAIVMTLLDPPAGVRRTRRLPAPCAPGQSRDCIGGTVAAYGVPPGPAASAPR